MKILSKTLYAVSAALLLLLVVLACMYERRDFALSVPLTAAVYATVIIVLAAVLYRFTAKAKGDRQFIRMIWGFSVVLFGLLTVIAAYMRYTPLFDLDAVYTGAINWGVKGDITSISTPTFDARTYFYYFPNNLGCTGLLALWFRICTFFGITDYMLAGFVLCAAMCSLTFAGTALTAFEMGKMYSENPKAGRIASIVSMLMFLITPPMLFCAHMIYTDFLSMPFGILGAYLLIRAVNFVHSPVPSVEQPHSAKGKRLLKFLSLLLASSVLTAIGIQIKATVGIVIIACAIGLVLKKDWKILLGYASAAAVLTLASVLILNLAVYPNQLDREKAKQMNTPMLHWVMMGLKRGSGGWYNGEDYNFTRSFSDASERNAAIKSEISDRLDDLGFGGVLWLAGYKLGRVFGDGTASVGDFAVKPEPETAGTMGYAIKQGIYDFINTSGRDYETYELLCDGMRLCSMLLFAAFAFSMLMSKNTLPLCLVPLLCILGIAIFLSFWEANDRYIVNMLPFLILGGACGAERVSAAITSVRSRTRGRCNNKQAEPNA